MRLDLYLKATRVVPRRTGAGDLCREGNVTVNGRPAKAARPIRPGDRILVQTPGRELTIEVLDLPAKKNVSKVEARTLYRVLGEKRFDFWGREIAPSK